MILIIISLSIPNSKFLKCFLCKNGNNIYLMVPLKKLVPLNVLIKFIIMLATGKNTINLGDTSIYRYLALKYMLIRT